MPLKKPNSDRKRRVPDPCISGRGVLSDSNHYYFLMVQEEGSAATVKSFPGRFKTSYSEFVIPESGVLFTAKPDKFNYETTIDSIRSFLTAHPVPEGKRYALVMDNDPWHKKTMRLIEQEMLPEYLDEICFHTEFAAFISEYLSKMSLSCTGRSDECQIL